VGADLAALRAVFLSSRVLRRDRGEVDAIFDELRERLEEELDYLKEAENLDFFRRALAEDKAIRVPATVPSHCTRRVLTMYRLEGVPIDGFLKTATPQAQQRAGLTVARTFHRMLYGIHALHADPHPGNYLFEPDGTVGLVDFGCVKRLDRDWVRRYARLAIAVIGRDKPESIRLGAELGSLAPGYRPEAGELMYEIADILCDPFRRGMYTAGASDDNVQARLKALSPRVLLYPELRSPREMVFVHRALGGMYAMVRRLKTRADWGVMVQPWLKEASGP
jgi:predicted unusual protein kinase regulating ubiquinone biosynthesis (AarF/ABC1/UbiB family)